MCWQVVAWSEILTTPISNSFNRMEMVLTISVIKSDVRFRNNDGGKMADTTNYEITKDLRDQLEQLSVRDPMTIFESS